MDLYKKKTFLRIRIFETHATENRCHFYFIQGKKKGGGRVGTTVIFIIHRRQVSTGKKKATYLPPVCFATL